jgi:UDP-N-acetylglucosamine acyltransferase
VAGLIHPHAQIDPSARLASGVRVAAGAVIGADVEIGEDCEIGAGAQVHGPTRMGRENRIYPLACVGFDPQDLKFHGERTELVLGDRNTVREFATLNRGTGFGGGVTRIGDENLFMAYTHVGHDSQVGSRTVFTNGATLAGHVDVADDATIGAMSAVHQFCRVGRHAYIGGFSVITLDALPFAKTVGQKPLCYGVNRIGLERKGFTPEGIRAIERAFRVLLRSGKNTSQALEELRTAGGHGPDVDYLIEFVATSKRGVIKSRRGGARGASTD